MWSEYSLDVVDAVARHGSFSAAAQELHRVPSAVSYTVRQLEQWLAVPLFVRRHRDVELTPAGKLFIEQARGVMKSMLDTRRRCQQVANGWSGQLKVAVDAIVKQQRCRQLVLDFYKQFPDVELLLSYEVFNGVWDALADERTDLVIGATSAVPVASHYSFRDMGLLNWLCVASARHPLAALNGPLDDDQLRPYPALCMNDTSRHLPKRDTWSLDNQRRLVVPNWASALDCLREGLCVGMAPAHLMLPLIEQGELVALDLQRPFAASPSCVAWNQNKHSPAMAWLLDYLGDAETMNQEWLNGALIIGDKN